MRDGTRRLACVRRSNDQVELRGVNHTPLPPEGRASLRSRMRLADVIGRWIGKVEIVLAGADEDLREGQEALALGDPMRARAAARRVLSRAPDSPIGLALLADACDAGHLDAARELMDGRTWLTLT